MKIVTSQSQPASCDDQPMKNKDLSHVTVMHTMQGQWNGYQIPVNGVATNV